MPTNRDCLNISAISQMLVNSYIVPFSYLLGDDLIEHKASDKTMPVATIFQGATGLLSC